MRYIAVFGPPGAGKSTVLATAIRTGVPAYDLEDAGATHEARVHAAQAFVKRHEWGIFGAADVAPEEFPEGTACVLLLPSEDVLRRRVEGRGDTRDHKWLAHAMKVRGEHAVMAQAGAFVKVFEDDAAPEAIVDELVALCGRR